MRFLVDESAGRAIVAFLRVEGHDVVAVGEAMRSAVDEDVLERAFADNRVLVTNDKDFGDLIYRSGRAHAGVLLLRLQDESPTTRVRVVAAVLANWAEWLSGNVVVATERSVRVRHPR